MDWLFRPIGDFFVWTFKIISGLNWKADLFIIFATAALMLYWFQQTWKHRKNDKGLFKKQ